VQNKCVAVLKKYSPRPPIGLWLSGWASVIAPSVIAHTGCAKNLAFKKFVIGVYDEILCMLHFSAQN